MPLKYLGNYLRSLETSMINRKVKLKLKWENYCAFSANVNGNDDANSNNIIFTINDAQLYVRHHFISKIQ